MTTQTGRTTSKWVDFRISDTADVWRSIPVSSINGVGLDYDIVDLTAFQDVIKNALPAMPGCQIDITGPFDTLAAQTAGTLSGSHTVLAALNGGVTPLSLDIKVGIRHANEGTEPQFGISGDGTNGCLVKNYIPDLNNCTYSATIYFCGGTVAPAWGTAAET